MTVDQDGLAKFTDLGVSGAYTGSGEIALEFFLDGSGMQICVSKIRGFQMLKAHH